MNKVYFVPVPEEEYFLRIGQAVYSVFMKNNCFLGNKKEVGGWLNHLEAAAYIKKTPAALYKLSSMRALKFSKRGKQNFYRTVDLDRYMEQGLIKTPDEIANQVRLTPRKNHFLTKTK